MKYKKVFESKKLILSALNKIVAEASLIIFQSK